MKTELDSGYVAASVVLGTFAHLWLHHNEPLTALQGVGYTLGIPGSAALLIGMAQNSGSVARVGAIERVIYVIIYLSTLLGSIVLYRLSPVHPLYHVPGPKIFKVTKLAGIGVSYAGHQHLVLKKLHDRYGRVVRIGIIFPPHSLPTTYSISYA